MSNVPKITCIAPLMKCGAEKDKKKKISKGLCFGTSILFMFLLRNCIPTIAFLIEM